MDLGMLGGQGAEMGSLLFLAMGLSIPFFNGRKAVQAEAATTAQKTDLEQEVVKLRADLAKSQSECDSLRWEIHQTTSIQTATLERFRTTFYELPIPAFTVNDLGHVMEWNLAASDFFGRNEVDVVDHPISSILGERIFRNDAEGMIYLVFMGIRPKPTEIELDMPDGQTRVVRWFASPIKNKKGEVVGALNTLGILPRFSEEAE